jgi:SAM-dependent methyltransferase
MFDKLSLFTDFQKQITSLTKSLDSHKWIVILMILLVSYILFNCCGSSQSPSSFEGFDNAGTNQKYVFKNNDIYDDFYVNLYDALIEDQDKIKYETGMSEDVTKMNKKSKVLDVGSGTGHHVGMFLKNGIDAVGLDKSSEMVKAAKNNYPNAEFSVGNASDSFLFNRDQFTHITCFYFTLYYMKDKKHFFENCRNWLKPKGYLIFHLVNKHKFDPIPNSGDPLTLVNPQNYVNKRITNSVIVYNDFTYKSNFKLNEKSNKAEFEEVFKFKKNGNYRHNVHTLYMEKQEEILKMAKDVGFKYIDRYDLVDIGYEHQYLYVFKKTE